MRNTSKHLTLLTRMKDDGLLPALTGSFSEDAIAQACGQVETLQLQERLRILYGYMEMGMLLKA